MPLVQTRGAASAQGFGEFAQATAVNYIEDVFSTWIYTGNGSTQTITNDIDLSTKGGLVWIKSRSAATNNFLFDTSRGVLNEVNSNTTDAQVSLASSLTAFNSNGFAIGSAAGINTSPENYVSWTFRKQPKFFDVVTYTGTGANRTVSHSLGSTPGCIFIKQTSDPVENWIVYHRSYGATGGAFLNTGDQFYADPTYFNDTAPTSTNFTLSTAGQVNTNGETYVAYLFAHDAGGFGLTGTDNVISCGTFTTDGSNNATVSLGYEPQWVMVKKTTTTGNWIIVDVIRGMPIITGNERALYANSAVVEDLGANFIFPTSTGFTVSLNTATYVYVAIRRGLMKVPIDATKVFQPVAYTGTNVDNRLVNTGILTDMTMARIRATTSAGGFYTADRLRGNYFIGTAVTSAEALDADSFMVPSGSGSGNSFTAMNGFGVGNDVTRQLNQSSTTQLAFAFRRAASFFDEVCYTGTGADATLTHNLGVAPQLIITKTRSGVDSWWTWCNFAPSPTNGQFGFSLNSLNAYADQGSPSLWGTTVSRTSTTISVGSNSGTNASATTYIAYLFATLAGVSKIGSYTGTATTLQIDCGFTAGARFVLIKRTDASGAWYVWDTARGIIAGNDPYLLLNSTAAEVTSTDYIDTYSLGFELSSTAPAAINASGGTFIFLAIA